MQFIIEAYYLLIKFVYTFGLHRLHNLLYIDVISTYNKIYLMNIT
jgi:hypothetical protein